MKLDSDLMTQKAGAATVGATIRRRNYRQRPTRNCYNLGVISGLTYKASSGKATELNTRN